MKVVIEHNDKVEGWDEKDSQRYPKNENLELERWNRFFLTALEASVATDKIKNFLSIGAGPGSLEIMLASKNDIPFTYVDPSDEFHKHFKNSLRKQNKEKLLKEEFLGKFETFQTSQSYDLILSIHSWYFIGLSEEILKKAIHMLSPGGKLFVLMWNSNSFQSGLYEAIRAKPNPYLAADEMATWVEQKGIKHKYSPYLVNVSLTDYIQNGEFTDAGKTLVEVLAAIKWDEISAERRNIGKEFLLRWQKNGQLSCEFGYLVFEK